jgi:predicted nucleotidyltransferase component of viral defense system
MAIKNMAASVLARLRNQARQEGISFQTGLQLFFQEEFLRRLSKSQYRDNMILKGGMFIYTLTEFDSRPTRDMDFMIRHLSNDLGNIQKIMEEICVVETENDFILLLVKGTERIAVDKKYPGVKTKLEGHINNIRVPFSIDVGIDDVIVPSPVIRKLSTRLEGFTQPEICTYSLESTLAEKLDAILQRMETTSRMKDFFDIYYLSNMFDFEGHTLKEAIQMTSEHRGRVLERESFERILAFATNSFLLIQWRNFEPAKEANLDFKAVLYRIHEFFEPLVVAIIENKDFPKQWNCAKRKWESPSLS